MKCIPGKTTRTYCIKCKSEGKVIGYISPMVQMECQCGEKWRTLSAICEYCKSPSGSPYYSDCINCLGKDHKEQLTRLRIAVSDRQKGIRLQQASEGGAG